MRAGGWQDDRRRRPGRRHASASSASAGSAAQVARVGLAFGMDVVAWSQNLTDERAAEVGVRRVAREELFATADVVTIHLLLSKRTRGLIGADDLALHEAHRDPGQHRAAGPIVDEAALIDALRTGPHRRAPASTSSTRSRCRPTIRSGAAPRTVLTPHLGYVTRGTYEIFYREAVEDVAAFLAGAPIRLLA